MRPLWARRDAALRRAFGLLGAFPSSLARLSSHIFGLNDPPVTHYTVPTDDGWRLALYRVSDPQRPARRPTRGPVLLQHGLAANRYTYLFPQRSLACWLSDRGFDCWVSELRGRGRSRRDGASVAAWDWDVEDYLVHDLPAIVSTILSVTGRRRLRWVGHSLGGILLYCYGIHWGGEQLAGGVTLGSALDYTVGRNDFQDVARYSWLLDRLGRIPYGVVSKLYAPLAGSVPNAFEAFSYFPGSLEPPVARRYFANLCDDVSPGVLASLVRLLEPGGLKSRDGRLSYIASAHRFTVPVLALGADRDRQCDPEAIHLTVDRLGSPDKAVRVFGLDHGDRTHYGHFDLLLGRHAPDEVWPVIADWLEAHS